MRTLRSFLVLLPLLAVVGCHPCGDPNEPTDPPAKTGRVLFEVAYTNHAWGYNHQGMYVDNEGNIYTYRWPMGEGARWTHDGNLYTEAELTAHYAPGSASAGIIARDSLKMMIGLMESASRGTFSDTTQTAADAGATHTSLYLYDARSKTYRQIALRLRGDNSFDNRSSSARQLADILEARWAGLLR